MSTIAAEALLDKCVPMRVGRRQFNPTLCFWVAGLIVYGGAALHFAGGHFLDQTSRDLWQHLAALRALIEDPVHPINPFVPTADPSRHFHPLWAGLALFARLAGWNEWQALAFGGFLNAGFLLGGIFAFGRTFYRDPWGPFALLTAMVLGWVFPISHTGYHSMGTLIEGIAYPAVLLIGLSLLLWTLAIRALSDPRWSIAIAPLVALMFATHPLGAGIGFIAAGCFIVFSPAGSLKSRGIAATAMAVGLAMSTRWIYFNPFDTILGAGNPQWDGGVDYYGWKQLFAATVPQLAGLIGLLSRDFLPRAKPVLIALTVYALLFTLGLFGVMIATRFIMPAVLMLHIGLAGLFLKLGKQWPSLSKRKQLTLFGLAFLIVDAEVTFSHIYLSSEARDFAKRGNVYEAAKRLTVDIADSEPVAGYDVSVWPVVATGQRAISIPWPEPGIPDLRRRQSLVDRLFDPNLSHDQRVSLARSAGVRILIIDEQGPLRRPMPKKLIDRLTRQSMHQSRVGPLLRFDLY